MNCFFDIETIPTQRADIREQIASEITAPGSIKLADTLAKWDRESKPAAVEKAIHATGLSGTFGEVFCIAWAFDDGEIQCAGRRDVTLEPEAPVLNALFDAVTAAYTHQQRMQFIGHYITEFDLRFLWQRAVVNSVHPPGCIPFQAKGWDSNVFDTRVQWIGTKNNISQDNLCLALNLPVKDGIDGSMVWDYVQQGRFGDVHEYCRGDVHRVREIYKRMQFTAA